MTGPLGARLRELMPVLQTAEPGKVLTPEQYDALRYVENMAGAFYNVVQRLEAESPGSTIAAQLAEMAAGPPP